MELLERQFPERDSSVVAPGEPQASRLIVP
jgi:hypothetical protein